MRCSDVVRHCHTRKEAYHIQVMNECIRYTRLCGKGLRVTAVSSSEQNLFGQWECSAGEAKAVVKIRERAKSKIYEANLIIWDGKRGTLSFMWDKETLYRLGLISFCKDHTVRLQVTRGGFLNA